VALSYDEKLKNTLKKFKYKYNKSLQKIFIPFLVKLFNDFLKNKIKKENTIIS
jgi:predicted amidophosphoribosyltransferase